VVKFVEAESSTYVIVLAKPLVLKKFFNKKLRIKPDSSGFFFARF